MMQRLALLAAALAAFIVLPASAAVPLLLQDGPARVKKDKDRTKVKRSRGVAAEIGAFKVAGLESGRRVPQERRLIANLFADAMLPVVLDAVELDVSGSFVWTGRVEGATAASSALISVNGNAMSASFSIDGRNYRIQAGPDGTHDVEEIDAAAFPDEINGPVVQLRRAPRMAAHAVAAADNASTFDVFVAYTHIVRTFYGSEAAVQALISSAVARANLAFANSNVTPRLRLVGTAELPYNDQAQNFLTALEALQDPNDGVMDSIHTLRNSTGADAVSLLVYQPAGGGCGIGYVMSPPSPQFEDAAFNVVRDDCADVNLSLAHEFGHNFGLEHDRANAVDSTPSYPYAYGYRDPTSLFRDVMSYNCPTGCPRLPYFSNPDVLYGGRPFGVNYLATNSADNARALNASASIIANFRQTVTGGSPPAVTFTDDPLVAGITPVRAIHLTELRAAINDRRALAGLQVVSWTDSAPAGVAVKAAHIMQMRSALTAALSAAPTFTDAVLGTVKAVHIQELRNLLK